MNKCPGCNSRLYKHCELKQCTWKKCRKDGCKAFTNGKLWSKPLDTGGYSKPQKVSDDN